MLAMEEDGGENSATAPRSLRKEPSFSRWCFDEEDGNPTFPLPEEDDDEDDEGFELPLLHQQEIDLRDQDLGNGNRNSFEFGQNGTIKGFSALHINGSAEDAQRKDDNDPQGFVYMIVRPLCYILLWYTFSTSLTLYNKLLLGAKMDGYSFFGEKMGKFPAPLLMNTIHFSMQGLISSIILRLRYPELRPQSMKWKDYFTKVVPTAVATALDVDLSNASLVFISVTFATMCKSSAPVFLLLFAFLFKLESPSLKLSGIIVIISFGVMLTVAKSTEFNFWGFLFVMLAALMSGLRWTLTQILLQKEEYGLTNPFATMSYVSPVMAVITVVFSFISESWSTLPNTRYFDSSHHVLGSCLLMLLGGSLAFFMVLCEYLLISATSAVTMTVAGIVKEVVTIVVAIFFFHDQFTVLKGIGLAVIICGVCLFNWYKYNKLKEKNQDGLKGISESEESRVKYVILDSIEDDAEREAL